MPASAPTIGGGQNGLAGDSGDDFDATGMLGADADDGQAQEDKSDGPDERTGVLDPTVAEFGPPGPEVGLVCCKSGGLCASYPGGNCPAGNRVKCPCLQEVP